MLPTLQPVMAPATIAPVTFPPTSQPTATDWKQLGDAIVGQAVGDAFGSWISLSADGSIIAAGAPENDNNGENAGCARVFRYTEQTDAGTNAAANWTMLGDFTGFIQGNAAGDGLGRSIDLSHDGYTLVTGIPYDDSNGDNAGSARVVEYQAGFGQWRRIGQEILEDDDTGLHAGYLFDYHSFGWEVSISGDGKTVVVDEIESSTVFVRVYEYTGSAWVRKGGYVGDGLPGIVRGVSLSVDGSVLAVGKAGIHVYRYDEDSADWELLGNIIPSGSPTSVEISSDGTTVAAGGIGTGNVQVFRYNIGLADWVQLGNSIASGIDGDFFGWSVAISADGSIVASGGWDAGAGFVRVYRYSRTAEDWEQLGSTIEGISDGDQFGHAVALSADGSIVAGGGRNWNERMGHVRVFQIDL